MQAIQNNWRKLTLTTLAVTAAGAWLASQAQIHPRQVWQTVESLGLSSALLALLFCCSQVFFLVWRYYFLIPREIHPGFARVAYAMSMGQCLNNYFPARAGDLAKCYLLSKGRRPMPIVAAAGMLVGDRVVDVASLLLMAVFTGSFAHPKMQEWLSQLPFRWEWVLAAVAVVAVAGVAIWLTRSGAQWVSKYTSEFRMGLLALTRPVWLLLAIGAAVLSWGGEAMAIRVLASTQGFHLNIGECVFVILALNLAISLPLSFANVGPFEAAIAIALVSFNMDSTTAVGIATVHHALQLLSVGLCALVGLLVNRMDELFVRKKLGLGSRHP